MPRKVNKQEALELIKSVDALELQCQLIFRTGSSSKKRALLREIHALIDSYVRDERDVIVLAIKVK